MPEIQQNGLDSLDRSFQELLKKTPEKRKELHERIADRLKETIDGWKGTRMARESGRQWRGIHCYPSEKGRNWR